MSLASLVAKVYNEPKPTTTATSVDIGLGNIEEKFQTIAIYEYTAKKSTAGIWSGKFKLRTNDGMRLVKDGGYLKMTPRSDVDEVVFTMYDADWNRNTDPLPILDAVSVTFSPY